MLKINCKSTQLHRQKTIIIESYKTVDQLLQQISPQYPELSQLSLISAGRILNQNEILSQSISGQSVFIYGKRIKESMEEEDFEPPPYGEKSDWEKKYKEFDSKGELYDW